MIGLNFYFGLNSKVIQKLYLFCATRNSKKYSNIFLNQKYNNGFLTSKILHNTNSLKKVKIKYHVEKFIQIL